MRHIKDPYTKLNMPTAVALGCFDGVHTAHAAVINEAKRLATLHSLGIAVWCFSEPPRNFYLEKKIPLVCDESEKVRLIAELGADVLVCPDFSADIAGVSARDFVTHLLAECAGARYLVCGKNYTFGRGGEGDVILLAELCRELGITLSVIDDVCVDGVKVSSTMVRDAVETGDLDFACKLLGRRFSVTATARDDREGLFVSDKYLCVRDGEYKVEASFDSQRVNLTATVSSELSGKRILLHGISAIPEVKVTFL